jgi:hypothetical protein
VGNVAVEHTDHVLAEIETETEIQKVLGSFRSKEHNALSVANILNDSRLNWVLEKMGVPYAPWLRRLTGGYQETKSEVSKKPTMKRAEAGPGRATPL